MASLTESPEAFGAKLSDWQGEADCEERWRSRLLWKNSLNLVAMQENEPVGMVAGVPQEDGSAELISMWVDPVARATGVAARLIKALLAWSKKCGHSRLWLRVHPDNERAIHCYLRRGFRHQGTDEDGDLVMDFRNF